MNNGLLFFKKIDYSIRRMVGYFFKWNGFVQLYFLEINERVQCGGFFYFGFVGVFWVEKGICFIRVKIKEVKDVYFFIESKFLNKVKVFIFF